MTEIVTEFTGGGPEFVSAECVYLSLATYPVPVQPSVGKNVEGVYLPDEMTDAAGLGPALFGAIESAALLATEIGVDGLLQGEVLDAARYNDDLYWLSFGHEVATLADSVDLLREADSSTLNVLGVDSTVSNSASLIRNTHSLLDRNWGIYSSESAGPVLIATLEDGSSTAPGSRVVLVELDKLAEAAPAEFTVLIEDIHKMTARRQLVDFIDRNRKTHDPSISAEMPAFMEELAAGDAVDGYRSGAFDTTVYLSWMYQTGCAPQTVREFINTNASDAVASRGENGLVFYTDEYLKHASECPNGAEAQRAAAARQLLFYKALRGVDTGAAQLTQEDLPQIGILRNPYEHMVSARYLNREAVRDHDLRTAGQSFIELNTAVPGPEQLVAVLERDWPECSQMLTEFMSWLGNSRAQTRNFDDIIGATSLRLKALGDNFGISELSDNLERVLGFALATSTPEGHFSGIDIDTETRKAKINNPVLSRILPAIIIRKMRENDHITYEHYKQLQQALVVSGREELVSYGEIYEEASTGLQDYISFRLQFGINDKEIDIIEAITAYNEPDEFESVGDISAFNAVFNALILHNRGVIDINNPVFLSFLKSFTNRPDLDLSLVERLDKTPEHLTVI